MKFQLNTQWVGERNMVSVRELDRFLVPSNCQQDRLLVIIDKVIKKGLLLVI